MGMNGSPGVLDGLETGRAGGHPKQPKQPEQHGTRQRLRVPFIHPMPWVAAPWLTGQPLEWERAEPGPGPGAMEPEVV